MRRVLSVLLAALFVSSVAWAQSIAPDKVIRASRVGRTAAPLREIAKPLPEYQQLQVREIPNRESIYRGQPDRHAALDPALQTADPIHRFGPPVRNFAGLNTGSNPPDTNGEIGPNHFFQTVNVSFGIYDRNGNLLLSGPNNAFFAGFGGNCEFTNRGDPIVLYDQIADRWVISQFTAPGAGSATQCVAVSETADPTGAYHQYEFPTPGNDYPKLSMFTDGAGQSSYLAGIRNFAGAFRFDAYAWERDAMLAGNSADAVVFNLSALVPGANNFLPSDLEGFNLAPAGTPAVFVGIDNPSQPQDELEMLELEVNWGNPASSSLTRLPDVAVAQFNGNVCNFNRSCIPQPQTSVRVDGFADAMMFRAPYRNFGSRQSLVCVHAVDTGNFNDHSGVRWHELNNAGSGNGPWALRQEGTYAPDYDHRWMPSIAINALGDIMMGYSVSSTHTYPSLRVAGRLATDPLNQLTFHEGLIVAGQGSQTSSNRWGDYSDMTVDPNDDLTFWYTNQYQAQMSGPKNTRIAAIFPDTNPPLVDITVEPEGGSPVIVGPPGTITLFDFDIMVENNGSSVLNTQVFHSINLPNNIGEEIITPVPFKTRNISVPPGGTYTETVTFEFPPVPPAGTYVFNLKVGTAPHVQLDRDTFLVIRPAAPSGTGDR
jgi:hypothetical protein